MPGERSYIVQDGDCLSSIAAREGFFWQTLWNHNAALKAKRKNPNVLLVGDEVLIPDKRVNEVAGATDRRHRFVKRGIPARLRLIVERNAVPLKNTRYTLTVDGTSRGGTTDGQGMIDVPIPPTARQGRLEIGDLVYELDLGGLDPLDEITGIQDRLRNLGFYRGALDGELGPETKDALAEFQSIVGLQPTGELDGATKDKLFARQDVEHAGEAPAAAADEAEPSASASPDEEGATDDPPDASAAADDVEADIPADVSDRA
jgi:Putative peptidoglycan binding domain/LysM domain